MNDPKTTTVSWGKITARPLDEIHFTGLSRSPYGALIADLLLRLEKTPAVEMLDVPFPDAETARKCKGTLALWFRKHKGEGCVRLAVAPNEIGGWSVLVARGPLYDKNGNGGHRRAGSEEAS
jgi:hypothetical protein